MINSANNIYFSEEKRPVRKYTRFLSTVFQPIYSAEYMEVYGYEALTRIENSNIQIADLFNKAFESGEILFLDMYCRQMAMKNAGLRGFSNQQYLFLNICPEVLLDPAHKPQVTDFFRLKIQNQKRSHHSRNNGRECSQGLQNISQGHRILQNKRLQDCHR